MTLVDRFICRREGHVPTVQLQPTTALVIKKYVTTCRRCRKLVEFEAPTGIPPASTEWRGG